MDAGRDYRSIVGIPGGVAGPLFAVLAAHNKHNMTLTQGYGGEVTDSMDEGVVYVYDTLHFPFYRAQQFHQYHTNDVLGRALPPSYTGTARDAAAERKWINPTCAEATQSGSNVEDIRIMDCGFVAPTPPPPSPTPQPTPEPTPAPTPQPTPAPTSASPPAPDIDNTYVPETLTGQINQGECEQYNVHSCSELSATCAANGLTATQQCTDSPLLNGQCSAGGRVLQCHSTADADKLLIYVGAVIGALVLLCVVACVCICRRKGTTHNYTVVQAATAPNDTFQLEPQ